MTLVEQTAAAVADALEDLHAVLPDDVDVLTAFAALLQPLHHLIGHLEHAPPT